MSLTSLSVLLAVVLLNVHLYGSALKPVPSRLRRILFYHLAPALRVTLHRGSKVNDQKNPRQSHLGPPRRTTTIYNAVFLNETDLIAPYHNQSTSHTLQSSTIHENSINSNLSSMTNVQTSPQSFEECKRLLTDMNRSLLRPTEGSHEEDLITRDWQNVALVIDRCLFLLYIFLTILLTVGTLILAPLLKTIPKPPNYHQINITRTWKINHSSLHHTIDDFFFSSLRFISTQMMKVHDAECKVQDYLNFSFFFVFDFHFSKGAETSSTRQERYLSRWRGNFFIDLFCALGRGDLLTNNWERERATR